jgi:hypothetical protein
MIYRRKLLRVMEMNVGIIVYSHTEHVVVGKA